MEKKFEELSDLIRTEIQTRKENNEEKLEEFELKNDLEDDKPLFSEKVDDMKEAFAVKLKEVKEKVSKKAKKASKQAKKAKKSVAEKVKKTTKNGKKIKKPEIKKVKNDLTKIKGLGQKLSENLASEGIISFNQLAKLSDKELKALDKKIKGFAARFKRYEWDKQARNMK